MVDIAGKPLTICVTGAAGFIASQTIAALLARGCGVVGTVRPSTGPERRAHLTALPGAERLRLVEADLLTEGAFDQAVDGADAVLHMASPYRIDVKDARRDLVEPAVRGTLNVLAAAQRAASVRRVVVTSSMAAVTDAPPRDHILTEADWNETSSLVRNPYYFAKTEAERSAWNFMERRKPGFDLVAINPFLVIGPSLTPALNTSNQIIVEMLTGVFPGVMALAWGFVDVRDVAEAHIRAVERPEAAGRYLCAADVLSMREVVALLKEKDLPGARLPSIAMDNALSSAIVRLVSYGQPAGMGSYLRSHVGRTPRYDAGRIRRDLGLRFRDVRATLSETADDLIRWGHALTPEGRQVSGRSAT